MMWALFFTPESDIPAHAAFPLFGREHIYALGLCLGFMVLLLLRVKTRSVTSQDRILKGLSILLLLLELAKDGILIDIGAFSMGYLPLHLCSLSMLLCLFYGFHPHSQRAGRILYSVALPSALSALLFPNWNVFPLVHFQSFHSFLAHTILLTFGLMPVVLGRCRPGLRAIGPSMGYLFCLAIPVGIFDHFFHTNYMFLRGPSKGSPLELLTIFPGKYGYFIGLTLLALGVITLLNLPFWLADRRKAR